MFRSLRFNDIAIRNVDQGKYVVYQKFSLFSRRNLLLESFEIEERIFGILKRNEVYRARLQEIRILDAMKLQLYFRLAGSRKCVIEPWSEVVLACR